VHVTQLHISLIDLQRQVVDYINRVSLDTGFFKHITRLKELKNSYELTERTNIKERISETITPLAFLPKIMVSTPLEKEYAHSIEFNEFVLDWYAQQNCNLPERKKAELIDDAFLQQVIENDFVINTDVLHEDFAQSSEDLFSFVMAYTFEEDIDYNKRIACYCDMAGLYAKAYYLSDDYGKDEQYEYLMIYAKEA